MTEYSNNPNNSESYVKSVSRFVRQCPAYGCRGFLSTQWKCGICEQWSCPQCHEVKGLNKDCEHECDPNSVETAKLLAKDSKPCPKCQSLIFKISGCDQIWCTQCHTAFSWKTGALENKIHNPHFYEWQRKNGTLARDPGDIECGRELDHNISVKLKNIWKKHTDLFTPSTTYRFAYTYGPSIEKVLNITQHTIHNIRVELPRFQIDYVRKNQDLRIKYLNNEINEVTFKALIQRNDKKHKKNTEIAQVIQLCTTTVTDIVYRIIDDLK